MAELNIELKREVGQVRLLRVSARGRETELELFSTLYLASMGMKLRRRSGSSFKSTMSGAFLSALSNLYAHKTPQECHHHEAQRSR